MEGEQSYAPTANLPEVVKVFIENDSDLVFLVKERGKPRDSSEVPKGVSQWRKRPGWGLPGGKVEGSTEEMLAAIRQHVRWQRIDPALIKRRIDPALRRFPRFEHVVLTSVKEVLEETGMLVVPRSIARWPSSNREVVWFVSARRLASGRRDGRDVQILESSWFPENKLPNGMYKRAEAMVRKAGGRQKGAKV